MNRLHRWYCQSSQWKQKLENKILPWSLGGVDLGDEVLEVGPGPGLTTDWLRRQYQDYYVHRSRLRIGRHPQSPLGWHQRSVQCGDATAMPFGDRTFSGAVAFTMLHHVPSQELQDRVFAEVYRVLRPGGIFAGTDSMPSFLMRIFHIRDTLVLVDPKTLPARLEAAGFEEIKVEEGDGRFRFSARRLSQTFAPIQ